MPKFHIAFIGSLIYNICCKNNRWRYVGVDNKSFSYRISNCCEDNVEFLNKLYQKYMSCYSDFLNNKPEDCASENEDFKSYLLRKEVEIMLGMSTEPNEEIWRGMAFVQDFIRLGYTSAPDFKWKIKEYNLGTEIKDIDVIKTMITKNKHLSDGIITDDGKFYIALGGHHMLNSWLLLHGIDTSKAVRVSSCLSSYKLLFSDLNGYCDMNHDLEITEAQARAMFNLYRLNSKRLAMPFQSIMLKSCEYKFLKGHQEDVFRKNLDTLETEVNKVNVDKEDYKNYQMNYFNANVFEKEIATIAKEKKYSGY